MNFISKFPLVSATLACVLFSAAAPAAEFHVSPSGSDANDGSPAAMLRTISEAARRAQPGDTVTVHAGIYRERIDPPRGGTDDAHRIVYQAAEGEDVVVTGAEPASGWVHEANDTWKLVLPNSDFGLFNPFNIRLVGDWFIDNGRVHHCGSVYLDDQSLAEAESRNAALAPTGDDPLWFAEVDGGGYLLNIAWLRPVLGAPDSGRIEAPAYSGRSGVLAAASSEGGECLGYIEDGDWAAYEAVDFGSGADRIEFRAASPTGGGIIEVRAGTPDGELLGTCDVADTGDWQSWQTFAADITPLSGPQSLCLVFRSRQAQSGHTTIWAQFKGVDPNAGGVEIAMRRTVFYPSLPGMDFITVRGFTLERAATPWAPPTAEQIGLIGTHWSKGWIIEDNTIRHSRCAGASLGKYGDRWDNTSQNTATGYVETIDRALQNGWNKATVGGHVVRDNRISHCGQAGVVGSLGGAFSIIEGNSIHDINLGMPFSGYEQAGIKLHGAIDTILRGNHIFRCNRGIWLDWMAQGTRVTRNLLHDNSATEDIYVEVNHGPFLVDHNVFLSGSSIKDHSEGGAYAHNLIAGGVSRASNSRSTPFHDAHSTALAGSANIRGSDSRFYNNIFAGSVSLAGYNAVDLPVFMDGNVFLDGATPSSAEADPLSDPGFDPAIHLRPESDGYYLDMQIDGTWDASRTRPLVTTALLGNAAVPGLPYEQPDASPYRLDTDYTANPRNDANPFPGPFEVPEGGSISVKVSSTPAPDSGGGSLPTLEPLDGFSFEAPDVADGAQSDTMDGWNDSASGSRVMDPALADFSNQFAGGTANVPDGSQDFVLFASSTGQHGWAYQALRGTTDADPAVHTLTGNEVAGQTIRVTFRVGRGLGANTYEDGEFHLVVGLQAKNLWNWHARTDYTKLDDGWGDVALKLAKDEWRQVTTDLQIPATPLNGEEDLVLAFNSDSSTPSASQIHIDAVTIVAVEAQPPPAPPAVYGGTHYSVPSTTPIGGTDEPELFREELYAERIRVVFADIPAGDVTLEFGAAELYFDSPGKRVFSISADGATLESALDIFAEAGGKNTVLTKNYVITHAGGDLTIDFLATVNNAKFSVLRIRDADGHLLGEAIARDIGETQPFPPPESEDDLVFFNADHAPVGAYASLLYGEKNSGGLMLSSGRTASVPGTGVLIASVRGNERLVMPFVEAGSRSAPFPAADIRRRIRAATDHWDTGTGVSWTHYSPPWPMRDFSAATTEEQKRFCRPATWIEFTVDNSSGAEDRDLIFSLREPTGTAATWGDGWQGYLVSGSSFTGGRSTAVAARSSECELLDAAAVSSLLGIDGANSALRFRTPPGETRRFLLVVAHYSTESFSAAGDFTGTFFYRSLFPSIGDVVASAGAGFDEARDWAQRLDAHLDASGIDGFRRFLSGHAMHSYRYSTIFLETDGGTPLWAVAEGEYAYLNTLDLTIDHLFYELAMHPWTMKNALEWFANRYSYTDTVKNPAGATAPGGISFTHDMGTGTSFAPAGTSAYEDHGTFMTQEELQNWILCAALVCTHTGDTAWRDSMAQTFRDAFDSMLARDDADPASRDGITTWLTTNGSHDEITTYDALDPALKQVRDNLYIAVKSWACYVALDKIFSDLGDSARATSARSAADATAASIVARWDDAQHYIPAIFDGANTSRIIPAVEGLVYPYRMGLRDAVSPSGPYGALIQKLAAHLDTVLAPGLCLDSKSGAWKLSSTSTNTWQSKVYLNQYVSESILGIRDERTGGTIDAIHADFQAHPVGAVGWTDQLNSDTGTPRGSRHYPRGVTSALWWMDDEIAYFEQGAAYFLETTGARLVGNPGAEQFRIEFIARRPVVDAGISLEQSPDLSGWDPATATVVPIEDLGDRLRCETLIDADTPRAFFRLLFFAR
jgi:hypothetical protein